MDCFLVELTDSLFSVPPDAVVSCGSLAVLLPPLGKEPVLAVIGILLVVYKNRCLF